LTGFANAVIGWQRRHGRHDLPWQGTRDAYRIWVSEIMLQQTQVGSVIPYYLRFVERFPDVRALAAADLDEVLAQWSGLGYYSRARNLHACARLVSSSPGGEFPRSAEALDGLPGIGPSTAAAIAAFAFGERAAILDGNVKRVFCRYFAVEGYPGAPAVERALWEIARRELPETGIDAYTQGLMDLGATLCTRARPACARCPLREGCRALAEERVESLPAPRPRRAVPSRRALMLVALRGDEVLLEKRPPTGIWGGLWSLPQAALPDDAPPSTRPGPQEQAALRELGAALALPAMSAATELPGFVHAFTHFRLQVRPVLFELPGARRLADPAGRVWLPLADVDAAALPQPVKALLRRVRELRSPGAAAGTGAPATAGPPDRTAPSASASRGQRSAGTRRSGSRPTPPTRTRRARRPSG
jgi:A/G-specific adenine glycosylase